MRRCRTLIMYLSLLSNLWTPDLRIILWIQCRYFRGYETYHSSPTYGLNLTHAIHSMNANKRVLCQWILLVLIYLTLFAFCIFFIFLQLQRRLTRCLHKILLDTSIIWNGESPLIRDHPASYRPSLTGWQSEIIPLAISGTKRRNPTKLTILPSREDVYGETLPN